MTIDVIEERLKNYSPRTKQEQLNAIKEICQEITLAALARSDFFKEGAFQGGTCLRVVHGLRRFSEDLDFVLLQPSEKFQWENYLRAIELEFHSFGLDLYVQDRSKVDGVVKKAFLKNDSFGRVLNLSHSLLPSDRQVIKVKLEIDTNPPGGSTFETKFLTYPYPFSLLTQDSPSLFAGKCHALLCREYVKGRDWYDFIWYVTNKTPVNFALLQEALKQVGPFENKELVIGAKWLKEHLEKKIETIDWVKARQDVAPFLSEQEEKSLELWGVPFFQSLVGQVVF